MTPMETVLFDTGIPSIRLPVKPFTASEESVFPSLRLLAPTPHRANE
jgi:hypothetical protein